MTWYRSCPPHAHAHVYAQVCETCLENIPSLHKSIAKSSNRKSQTNFSQGICWITKLVPFLQPRANKSLTVRGSSFFCFWFGFHFRCFIVLPVSSGGRARHQPTHQGLEPGQGTNSALTVARLSIVACNTCLNTCCRFHVWTQCQRVFHNLL